jgi:hypothetical protein
MTCEYCGLRRPVPDADKRRARLEREGRRKAEQQRKAEEKARRQAERQARSRQERRRSAVGWVLRLPLKLLPLAVVGFLFYQFGGYELLFGDDGRQALAREVSRLEAEGYRRVTQPASRRFMRGQATVTVGMERGSCYAVAVGAGKLVSTLRVRRFTAAPNQPGGSVELCPRRSGGFQVKVVLAEAGRFSWALLQRPRPGAHPHRKVSPRRKASRRSKVRQRRRRRPPRKRAEPRRRQPEPPPALPAAPPDPFESEVPLEP